MGIAIAIDREQLALFCRRNQIRKLAFFGSAIRNDFREESDVDVLVEFGQGETPGLLQMVSLEQELTEMFGRKADLRTPAELSRYFRNEVVESATVAYEAE
ncbi:MAG: nucleotidyltransferase domain-containing protein [Candidatus Hydrogenedentales bacterium]|jgi:hypothetical protein